jgi:hypothetical protein
LRGRTIIFWLKILPLPVAYLILHVAFLFTPIPTSVVHPLQKRNLGVWQLLNELSACAAASSKKSKEKEKAKRYFLNTIDPPQAQ